ncbi:hypothetical protein K438DRAFT_1955428 [Mycena galopus ATCC 62051]|nr:hypothetical protein K438DRAFT_1955428 [Mycena galopus ATCC 62051]
MPNKGVVTVMNDWRSSHLLGLILEFRPGTTILIPSAAIFDSNMPIAVGKRWYSFTQYTGVSSDG